MASEYCDYTKIKLRPCVLEAAVAMELKLRKHDGKRGSSGWRRDSTVTLLKRAVQELGEAFGEVGEPHAELGWDGQVRGGGEPPAVFADPCDAASFAEAHEWDVDYADWPVAEIVAETAGCPARVEAARGK